MLTQKIKVIFFIASYAPTKEEIEAAEKLERPRTQIVFRNAALIHENDSPERCDAVAGKVPNSYSEFPIFTGEGLPKPQLKPELPPEDKGGEESDFTQGVKAFSGYALPSIQGMIERKEITRDYAVKLEKAGKARAPILAYLSRL